MVPANLDEVRKTRCRLRRLLPETWTTCGMTFLPSMVVMRVTLAHAILCGSRATRMMQRFVRGEKYLTDNDTTFVSIAPLGRREKIHLLVLPICVKILSFIVVVDKLFTSIVATFPLMVNVVH